MKLYVYPQANDHVHDHDEKYINTVPLSKMGIEQHCEIVDNPFKADYFYMGQFGDGQADDPIDSDDWEFFYDYPEYHIADIEGDWLGKQVPEVFRQCITTRNGVPLNYGSYKTFVRPTFSTMLVDSAKNKHEEFEPPANHAYCFQGLPDPYGVRQNMYNGLELSNVPFICRFNSMFLAPIPVDDPKRQEYIDIIKMNSLALCPRGAGLDSVRWLEVCYLARCPIIIGNNKLFGADRYNMSFVLRIDETLSPIEMAYQFKHIYSTVTLEEATERGKEARKFFDTVVRDYFNDPTDYFIRYLGDK